MQRSIVSILLGTTFVVMRFSASLSAPINLLPNDRTVSNDTPEIIASEIRELEDRLHQHHSRLDCFDYSKCVLIHHADVGRSGNRKIQLEHVESVLSRCSGAAIAQAGAITPSRITENVVHFAPMQVFGKASCFPAWDKLTDMEAVIHHLTSRCQVINFTWADRHFTDSGLKCSLDSPPVFHQAHLNKRLPAWLEISLNAWTLPLDDTTAVLHFRGGDLFRDVNRPDKNLTANTYNRFQPVCDHYIQSFRHSGATCALLVAEDDKNPCVAVVEANLKCTRRPPQPVGNRGASVRPRPPWQSVSGAAPEFY